MIAILKFLGGFGSLILKVLVIQVPFFVVLLGVAGTYYILEDPFGDERLPEPTYVTATDTVWIQGEAIVSYDTTVTYRASPPLMAIREDTVFQSRHDTVYVKITSSGEIRADTTVRSPTEKVTIFTRALWPSGMVHHRFKFEPYPVREKRWLFAFGGGLDFRRDNYEPFILADLNYRGYGLGAIVRENSVGGFFRKTF